MADYPLEYLISEPRWLDFGSIWNIGYIIVPVHVLEEHYEVCIGGGITSYPFVNVSISDFELKCARVHTQTFLYQ